MTIRSKLITFGLNLWSHIVSFRSWVENRAPRVVGSWRDRTRNRVDLLCLLARVDRDRVSMRMLDQAKNIRNSKASTSIVIGPDSQFSALSKRLIGMSHEVSQFRGWNTNNSNTAESPNAAGGKDIPFKVMLINFIFLSVKGETWLINVRQHGPMK